MSNLENQLEEIKTELRYQNDMAEIAEEAAERRAELLREQLWQNQRKDQNYYTTPLQETIFDDLKIEDEAKCESESGIKRQRTVHKQKHFRTIHGREIFVRVLFLICAALIQCDYGLQINGGKIGKPFSTVMFVIACALFVELIANVVARRQPDDIYTYIQMGCALIATAGFLLIVWWIYHNWSIQLFILFIVDYGWPYLLFGCMLIFRKILSEIF